MSSRTIRSAALNCLRSGHSHEDIDQMFGQLATFMLRSKDLQDPTDVKRCIQAFLDKAKLFEKERRVGSLTSCLACLNLLCSIALLSLDVEH